MRLPRALALHTSITFLLLLSACGGLAGEPQILATFAPEPTSVADVGYPLRPPDLARGAAVYAQHCTRCHGAAGAGDGELVQSGQVAQMASFTNPETARAQTPQEWFNTITNGRIEQLMPPWKDSLSEEDRWNVALYTYTLSYAPDQIALGEQLWDAHCADCHGATGLGDGPRAAEINRPIGNLTEQTEIVALSDDALYNIVAEGVGENMPAFADDLTDDERRAVVAYARALTVTNFNAEAQAAQPAATPEPDSTGEASAILATVSGRVTNGTVGSVVPPDLQINLVITENGSLVAQEQTTPAADGAFQFADVPIIADADYVVATVYRERLFTSGFVIGDPAVTAMDMPLTIYELTEDPAVISITGVVSQVSAVGDTLEVREVVRFQNSSDRVFTSSSDLGSGRFASLVVALPPGAQIVSFDDPQRYVISEQDFSFVDTAPVYPGADHLAVVVYILPYDGSAALIEQPVNYPLDGQVRLLMYPENLSVNSEQLPSLGPQQVGEQTYTGYGAPLQLAAGDVIRYEVSGSAAPGGSISGTTTAVPGGNLLPVLLLIIGALTVLAGLIFFVRTRNVASGDNKQVLIDALVRQIAELDDAHAAGQLNHDLWHRQRAQLKARLAELLGEEKEE